MSLVQAVKIRVFILSKSSRGTTQSLKCYSGIWRKIYLLVNQFPRIFLRWEHGVLFYRLKKKGEMWGVEMHFSTRSLEVHPSFFCPIKLSGNKIKARLSHEKPDGIFIGLPERWYSTFGEKNPREHIKVRNSHRKSNCTSETMRKSVSIFTWPESLHNQRSFLK